MLCSIFLEISLDFATLTSVKKVGNLQHENLPIQDINFPTKNSKSPDLGSRMYHMYDQTAPLGVLSGSALFAQTYLSENLGSLRYLHYLFFSDLTGPDCVSGRVSVEFVPSHRVPAPHTYPGLPRSARPFPECKTTTMAAKAIKGKC